MKKSNIYIAIFLSLAIGLLLGWFLFGNTSNIAHDHPKESQPATGTEIWTCSMHPQIRQEEKGECPICGMDLTPATQVASSSSNAYQMTAEAIKLANIQTSIIGNSTNNEGAILQLNGKIQANETKSASLVSHIPGRIENLYVSYTGEQVKKGQKIATIYSAELITAQKELLEAQKIADISPGLLKAASNKLRYWKIGEEVIADILDKGVIRETFDIYAEHAGIVNQRRVTVGDHLSSGEVLFNVQNLRNLWALFDVYEKDLPKIRMGKKIRFTTPSAPNKTFNSNITFVNPVINPQTRVATIRAEVFNANGRLKPEMFITGELSTSQKSSKLMAPKSAVLWTGQRSVVYVKKQDSEIPSFEYREVELGESSPDGYEIISGLEDGEEIVTNGAFVIDASAQLNNQASMMNKKVRSRNVSLGNQLPDYISETSPVFKGQLSAVATSYFAVKDALVASRSEDASKASVGVLKSLENVDMTLVKDEAHLYWMEQLHALQSHTEQISELEDLEEQRKQFDFLSQALIKSLKVFGVASETFYVQHCPMANDNDGADWLSEHKNILNPYFGDKMLTCGMVQDTIDINFENQAMLETSSSQLQGHNH